MPLKTIHEHIEVEAEKQMTTRKLCCRKDDRAMHPIYGCHENFLDSLTMHTATFPKIFHGLLF